jgi:hypothetical protein
VPLALLAAGCADSDSGDSSDDLIRINEIQVIGSHNSYHIQARPELYEVLLAFSEELFGPLAYTHVPLEEQFEAQGIRQIELDIFADPEGGLYALRRGLIVIGEEPNEGLPELEQPGFKVLHVQDVDFETTCLTLVSCLQMVKAWSDAHPRHLPIMILIEAKDDVIPDPVMLGFTIPLPIGTPEFDQLDAEIRSVFPPEQLITPDDVRQGLPTLEEAVLTRGWPTLREARGRVLFALDNGGAKGDAYRSGHPVLEGRVLFTNASPGDPDAAFVKENDPLGNPARIPDLVSRGYLVRTRADADTVQARTGDTTQRDAALASGAQYVSTDYRVENPDFGTGYSVSLPGEAVARCNPINAPPACATATLE